jgi:hypothetical protein
MSISFYTLTPLITWLMIGSLCRVCTRITYLARNMYLLNQRVLLLSVFIITTIRQTHADLVRCESGESSHFRCRALSLISTDVSKIVLPSSWEPSSWRRKPDLECKGTTIFRNVANLSANKRAWNIYYLETRILQQQPYENLKSGIRALVQKLFHKAVATEGRVVLPTRGSRLIGNEK